MKKTITIILTLIGFIVFGQENDLGQIKNKVDLIESDSTLTETEFNWVELTGIATDGGGILKVWRNKKQIYKVVEEIGFSYGRVRTIMYLDKGIPIKIIETEENFGHESGKLNKELNEVFRAIIYIFDWEGDISTIERIGERVFSEGTCSTFDYESTMERTQKAITE